MSIYKNIGGTLSEEFSIGKKNNNVSVRIKDGKLQGKDKDGEWCDLIFDKQTHEINDPTESSTSNSEFKKKLTLTTNYIPAGRYRIGWSYEWLSSLNTNFEARVVLNDTVDLPNATPDTEENGKSAWLTSSSFAYVNLESGIHHLDIFYRSEKKNKAIKIRNTKIELWRVS